MFDSLWVEKYRPKTLEDIVLSDDNRTALSAFTVDDSIPNLLFTGKPGIGKTSLAKIIVKENWGLKKFAYPIQNKKSGFYHLIEYQGPVEVSKNLEMEFRRDERVMRYLTVKLDKHALDWSVKRRKKNKVKSKV